MTNIVEMPPLHFSDEEKDLLLALAAPIDQRQREHFCSRSRPSSRRRPNGPASGTSLARCIGSGA